MEREELAAWLRLDSTPGLGRERARRLLAAFASPQAVLAASPAALAEVAGSAVAAALQHPAAGFDALLARTAAWLEARDGVAADRRIVALGDPGYPAALLTIEDPPLLLYLMGRPLPDARQAAIAIVGSRNPTPQGLEDAQAFARCLAEAGLCVVSGLARGIDGAAHRGALEAAEQAAAAVGGAAHCATVAVVGTGLDRVYPRQHLALAHRIAAHGCLVSEYALGTPPLAANFPRRNRLIAGLSLGTLVVEATEPSGSLITARVAAEQGREVFAVPGSIHSPLSRGCHALIRQGAKLVESARDVLEELRLPAPDAALAAGREAPPVGADADDREDSLLAAMGHAPLSLDALVARTGLDAAHLQARLLELELDGRVARLPGGLLQQLARA